MNDVDIATHSLPASFIAHLMPRHVVIFAPDFFDLPARAAPTAAAAALPISGPRLRIGIDRVGNHAAERLNRVGFGVVVKTKLAVGTSVMAFDLRIVGSRSPAINSDAFNAIKGRVCLLAAVQSYRTPPDVQEALHVGPNGRANNRLRSVLWLTTDGESLR